MAYGGWFADGDGRVYEVKGMKYPKIDTLWKRDENNKFRIIECDYSKIEFTNWKGSIHRFPKRVNT